MKEKVKDVLIRAGKTFWQAALATLVVAIPEIINLSTAGWNAMRPVLVSAGIGALAAGFSAVYNGLIAPVVNKGNGGESPIDEGK